MPKTPHTKAMPIIGNLPEIQKYGFLGFVERSWQEHGDVFWMHIGPKRALVVSSAQSMEELFASKTKLFIKGRSLAVLRTMLDDSIFTNNGPPWRKMRKIQQPFLQGQALRGMIDNMSVSVNTWLGKLRAQFPDGGVIDLHEQMTNLTLELVCSALFGPNLLDRLEVPFEGLCNIMEAMHAKFRDPSPLWVPTPANRRVNKSRALLDRLIYQLIDMAKENQQEEEIRRTLLGMLLHTIDEDTGEPLPDSQLRNEIAALFLAGHETTALALTWTYILLQDQPEHRAAMHSEFEGLSESPTFDELSELESTKRILFETLRLRGPISMNVRDAADAGDVCGHPVKKGDMIMPFVWGLHHHPEYWDAPRQFDPDRFLSEAEKTRNKWAYLPFGGGSRKCLGMNFAVYEARLALALLHRNAKIELLPGQDIEPDLQATLRPSKAVFARLDWN